MRQLTNDELNKLEFLTSRQVEVALVEPTATGLRKSIMDATADIRDYLVRSGAHDFASQPKGQEYKKIITTKIYTMDGVVMGRTSFYRPVTKQGDPRLWISHLGRYSSPGDIVAMTFFEGVLNVFNLTKFNIQQASSSGLFADFVRSYSKKENEIASELIGKIRLIAKKGFIQSPYTGDTAIGHLLEDELGIPINSKKEPDYKGIELKSARAERKNRKNLFAQVPDWNISKLKSSRAILDAYGYKQDGILRLYCTVKATQFNPQTLRLSMDLESGLLKEYSSLNGDVVSWRLRELEDRLATKHKETFWVEAQSKVINNVEYFKFVRIEHTKDPILSQLSVLIDQGKITVDHLIKEKGASAAEKGPIFKLDEKSLGLLFPASTVYEL